MTRVRRAELQADLGAVSDDGRVLSLMLPWPPTVNHYWRTATLKGTGRTIVYKTREAKVYCDAVGWICKVARKFAANVDVILDITLHPPTAQRRDADNFNKGVWDALVVAGVLADDCQVQSYRVTKGAVQPGGCVLVKIWERGRAEVEVNGEGRELSGAQGVSRQRASAGSDGEVAVREPASVGRKRVRVADRADVRQER